MSPIEPRREDATAVSRVVAGLTEGLAYCAVLLSPELVIEWVSPASTHMVGWKPDELVGRNALDLLHPDDLGGITRLAFDEVASLSFAVDPADLVTNFVRVLGADGAYRSLEMAANNQVVNPAVHGYVLMLRDATDQRLTIDVFQSLAKGESIDSVVRAVAALLAWQVRGSGVEVIAVDAAGARFRCTIEAPSPLTSAVEPVAHELYRDGEVVASVAVQVPGLPRPTEWCRTLVERAADLLQLALARDADAARLTSAAHTDPLTGLLNRAGLAAATARVTAHDRHGVGAVLYIDLDDFKTANDRWGHLAGDAVLVETARRLRRCTRGDDFIARLGGDEFVVVCTDLPDAGTARALATRVLSALAAPVAIGTELVGCAASVGLAIAGRSSDLDALLERADAALLRAKRDGKARVVSDGPRSAEAS